MPFQNLVCPAAPLIGHLLLHSSSQRTLIYIVDALRAPRGGFPFSTSGGVDSLQHPFPLFLSLFLSRHSVLHTRCRSFNRLALLPSPSLSVSVTSLHSNYFSNLLSVSPPFFSPPFALADTLFRQSRLRSSIPISLLQFLPPPTRTTPSPPPACSRPENIPRRW